MRKIITRQSRKVLAQVTSGKLGVGLQKLNEYMPDSLAQYQLLMALSQQDYADVLRQSRFSCRSGSGR